MKLRITANCGSLFEIKELLEAAAKADAEAEISITYLPLHK